MKLQWWIIVCCFSLSTAIFDNVAIEAVDHFPFSTQFDWSLGMGFLPLFFKNYNGCSLKALRYNVNIPVSGKGTTIKLDLSRIDGAMAMQCASIALEINAFAIRFQSADVSEFFGCTIFETEGSCDSLQVLKSSLDLNGEGADPWYRSTYQDTGGNGYMSPYYFNPQRVNYVNNFMSPFADPHFTDPLYSTGILGPYYTGFSATSATMKMRRSFWTRIRSLFATLSVHPNSMGYMMPDVDEYSSIHQFDKATRFYVTTDNFLSCFMFCEKFDTCTGVQFFARKVDTRGMDHSPVGCGMYFASYEKSLEITRTTGEVTFAKHTNVHAYEHTKTPAGISSRTLLMIKPTFLGKFFALPTDPYQQNHERYFKVLDLSGCSTYYGNDLLVCKSFVPRRGSGGCPSNQYVAVPATIYNNQLCLNQPVCTPHIQYECHAPTETSARACCQTRTSCYFTEISSPTESTDRLCAEDIPSTQWYDISTGTTKDRTQCVGEEELLNRPTPITDNLCGFKTDADCGPTEYALEVFVDEIYRSVCVNRTECRHYLEAPTTKSPGTCADNSIVFARVQRNAQTYFWGLMSVSIILILIAITSMAHFIVVYAVKKNPEALAASTAFSLLEGKGKLGTVTKSISSVGKFFKSKSKKAKEKQSDVEDARAQSDQDDDEEEEEESKNGGSDEEESKPAHHHHHHHSADTSARAPLGTAPGTPTPIGLTQRSRVTTLADWAA